MEILLDIFIVLVILIGILSIIFLFFVLGIAADIGNEDHDLININKTSYHNLSEDECNKMKEK